MLLKATTMLFPYQPRNSVLRRRWAKLSPTNGLGQNIEARLRIWSSLLKAVTVIQ